MGQSAPARRDRQHQNATRLIPISVWLFALLLAALTSLPYLLGWLNTPEDWVYSGAPVVPAGTEVDYNSHLAKMWQGSRGQWDYQLLFTHEPHAGVPLLQGFYVALGALAALTPFSLPLVYHGARFLLTVGMVVAVWLLAARYFECRHERWLVLCFGLLASGWSWLILLIDPAQAANVSPIEFWLLDAFNLLGALSMPHFAAAVMLQIVVILAFDRWLTGGHWQTLLLLTLALAAESVIQPYVVLLFGPLLSGLALYRVFIAKDTPRQRLLWLAVPGVIHGLLVVYQFIAVSNDPVWASFTAQNITASPPVIYYLLGYLPFLLPAVVALPGLFRRGGRWWLLLCWVLLVMVLLYAPLPTQRRYLLGVQTPLALLAVFGWTQVVLPRLRRGYRPLASILYLTLASVGMLAMLASSVGAASNPNSTAYYAPDEWGAYEWLREDSDDGVILTVFDRGGQGNGGRVVAATGRRVFAGHWIETAFLDEKVGQLQRFFDPATADSWRQAFLNEIGATLVWYDEYSRAFGTWNPADADFLDPVYESDLVTIYRVK